MRLAGKVAYITGGASGIGAACARIFAREGASVAVVDRDAGAARALADELRAAGASAVTDTVNVTDREAVEASMAGAADALGELSILVNSAGITARNLPQENDWLKRWEAVMEVNVKGTVVASAIFCERAAASGQGGAIVNLSSIYGQVARPPALNLGPDGYTHSKGAVLQITRDFAIGNVAHKVRVNCLCPGFIRTPMTAGLRDMPEMDDTLVSLHPMGRLGEADEVANCALFLASDEASFVTGAILPVDGGYLAV